MMIQKNIQKYFPKHLKEKFTTEQSIYVVDYTNLSKSKKGVKFFDSPPKDIEYFILNNPHNIKITGLPFGRKSFRKPDGNIASQCECVIYPKEGDETSWICFIELKYSNTTGDEKDEHPRKARRQLFKTKYYYQSKGVFDRSNTCYLFISQPTQPDPFPNFSISEPYLSNLKSRFNTIIRVCNGAEIVNPQLLLITPEFEYP